MKRLLICIIMISALFTVPSCVVVEDVDHVNVVDSLKISTWVLDEELEGNGCWVYDKESRSIKGFQIQGHWISDDGTELYDPEKVYVYESLEPNVPRISAPLGFSGYNLNLRLESDDVIVVSTTIKNNEDIRLSYSPSSPDEVIISDWVESETISAVGPFTLNVYPVGKLNSLGTQLIMRDTLTDREYYINIDTYKLDGTPVISAQLKLTVLDDPEYPYYEISGNKLYSLSEERSRFLSIELVKYGFDDTALHDEFEKYDALYN